MVYQGKSGGNPDGLPSILTQIKRKFTFQNHGSDLYYHPKGVINVKGTFTLMPPAD